MKRSIGIDLGTTNTALSIVDLEEQLGSPEIFPIPQVVRPGDVLSRPTLPSFLYLAAEGELPPGSLDLPWAKDRSYVVGTAARERGAESPLRLVSSSKSWLSHSGVDRRAAILPHPAADPDIRVSPVTAALRILEHLRDAYNAAHNETPLAEQSVLLTVPASFDPVARDLTLDAARMAGLGEVVLLEEPQAAFYAWLARVGDEWRNHLGAKDRVLVVDVGGGTSDFTLIEATDDGFGNLGLERIAVGDHLLLGGDNMDLALAYRLQQRLLQDGKKLDIGQQRALTQAARRAKESLLSDRNLDDAPITVLGRGSKLIGGQIKTVLTRADLEATLLEGFFPLCDRTDRPTEARRTGFIELGLPFAADAAITRHLAAFLAQQGGAKSPTHVLFNGGVFNSPLLRTRLLGAMEKWFQRAPLVLENTNNDLAVAQGAAYYGATRKRGGLRIRGGVAKSYYIAIESPMPAVPGVPPPVNALCVVPFGMEEGTSARVEGHGVGLIVGEPVEFRFLSSNVRKNDQVGTLLDSFTWPDDLIETSPLSANLPSEGFEPGTLVPVTLEVKVTELGTLELWSVARDGQRWRIEFNMREGTRND
jgi:molecular chaperone DnaK (HSP70)